MNHRKNKHEFRLERLDRLLKLTTDESGQPMAGYVRMFVNMSVHKRLNHGCIGHYAKTNTFAAYPDLFSETVTRLNQFEMAEYFGRRVQIEVSKNEGGK